MINGCSEVTTGYVLPNHFAPFNVFTTWSRGCLDLDLKHALDGEIQLDQAQWRNLVPVLERALGMQLEYASPEGHQNEMNKDLWRGCVGGHEWDCVDFWAAFDPSLLEALLELARFKL